ncbi:glycerophosphodiester phosphodiesterase [Caldibacillus lycopersici]|uniref:Glycerophosphodiester phosphodiesterase n=1 Tax=Perspicuibacillus lycopersici TaxID=1325689 RepID=A0AAE3IUU9_9BACI|nr:glycerophosphodiester phosphodiesterase [Perspicuibacillus lycopersici]MCU9613821.1 glycerophosphodiester phosphodiesterase [Perspicuibacillus lycopersici]
MTLIFAHRGSSSSHPENTMISFMEANKAGADGIELDVQLTKDGEIVIIHDDKVDRTTNGKGFVKDLTLAEIKQLNAGHHFKKGTFEDTIPTLQEFLTWFKQTNLLCNIEYKSTTITNHELEDKVVQLVRQYQLEDRIIFSSFNHYSIVYSYRLAPEIETAPLYMEGIYMPWVYADSIRAKGIHPHYKVTPNELIILAQQNGIAVRPFTINQEKDIKRFMEVNTAAIITDYPAMAREIKNNL